MFRHLGFALAAVSMPLVLGLLVAVIREIPVAAWLVLLKSVAPD